MSAFYVSKNGKKLGPFGEAEVIAKLDSGEFSENDQVMTEGLPGWTPLGSLIVREPGVRSAREIMEEWLRAAQHGARRFSALSSEMPLATGSVLVALGCLVMFLSQWPVLLFGPLFLLALVAAWPLLLQQRIAAAITFLILSLVIPFLLWDRISSRAFSNYLTNQLNKPVQGEIVPAPTAMPAPSVASPAAVTSVQAPPAPVALEDQPAPAKKSEAASGNTPAVINK